MKDFLCAYRPARNRNGGERAIPADQWHPITAADYHQAAAVFVATLQPAWIPRKMQVVVALAGDRVDGRWLPGNQAGAYNVQIRVDNVAQFVNQNPNP